jgi:hypothetical protein
VLEGGDEFVCCWPRCACSPTRQLKHGTPHIDLLLIENVCESLIFVVLESGVIVLPATYPGNWLYL